MQSGCQDLSGWTDKPGCNVRANAKTGSEICAEDNSVIRLLPSLILPGLAAGTSSMMASAKSGRSFNPSQAMAVFWLKTATFFFSGCPKSIGG
jgi:hypothetical protein